MNYPSPDIRIWRTLVLLLAAAGFSFAAPGKAPLSPVAGGPLILSTDPDIVSATGSASLPLLPLPRHSTSFTTRAHLNISRAPLWTGLDRQVIEKLQPHWSSLQQLWASLQQPSSSQPQDSSLQHHSAAGLQADAHPPLRIGLLGKDPAFDAFVTKKVPFRKDSLGTQGYILLLDDTHPFIAANTDTGLFYGLQSLKQLIRAHWDHKVIIVDWPSFGCRAVYDDISRGPISTVDYIKSQIERMAEIKINYLSFYIEHVVQPLSHPDFAPPDGKLTIAQIKELSAYAAGYYMQLIGSFQSFGHFEKILSLPAYASLGATSNLISPTDPRAKDFLKDVIGELCDAFNGPWFNVNCDETFDLGQGLTKPYVDSMGAPAFYALHLRFLDSIVRSHHKKMMMWGDFILQHPETLDLLPKDITYLTWEYGDLSSFDHWITPFASRHLPFMVCPGILNTYRLFPDMVMAKANISRFAAQGFQQGASGLLTTIWDDGGAWLFSGDWYGVYVTAESGWCPAAVLSPSFNRRYAQTAYGTSDESYTNALFTLMQLRNLPLTYNLNDGIWFQRILPDSGKKLLLNNESAGEALGLLAKAALFLNQAHPDYHTTDIRTLGYTIRLYKLIILTRLRIAEIARRYDQARLLTSSSRLPQAAQVISQCIRITDTLVQQYQDLRRLFGAAWQDEDQPYWLNKALGPYDEKITELRHLSLSLAHAKANIGQQDLQQPMPPASVINLSVRESPYYFFQGWMLAGPFITDDTTAFPSFLYAEDPAYNKPPVPGDFTTYKGRMRRWKKYASATGGFVDLDEFTGDKPAAVVYAYCQINSDSAGYIHAFASSQGAMEIFCNGNKTAVTKIRTNADADAEKEITLPLQPGINHILVKLRKKDMASWTFTFRIDDAIKFTNHKYKYQLNGKNKLYAAD